MAGRSTRVSETTSPRFEKNTVVHHDDIVEFMTANGGDWWKEYNTNFYVITRTVEIYQRIKYYD